MANGPFVWLNDALTPAAQAAVSVNDRGFLYGDGLFETIRVEAGRGWFLPEHLARLKGSAQALRLGWPGGFAWEESIAALLAANGLERGLARLKIQLSRGVTPGLGMPPTPRPTLVMWAEPYTPPSAADYAAGWPVVVFPQGRSTFMGRHKSLNYLFYLAARQYALDHGAREAIVLEADGVVSEGAATSLIYTRAGRFFTPAAASALPGITVAMLRRGLSLQGAELEAVPTDLGQLLASDGLWLANSLMGLMPAASLDGVALPLSPLTAMLQEVIRTLAAEPH
jgi:branched-chain amino acid aminotransferase/para-aminobenzoate synthetase component 1